MSTFRISLHSSSNSVLWADSVKDTPMLRAIELKRQSFIGLIIIGFSVQVQYKWQKVVGRRRKRENREGGGEERNFVSLQHAVKIHPGSFNKI